MSMKTFYGKTKSLALGVDAISNADGKFEGYANKPIVDRYNEVVDVAAFEGTLRSFERNPIMLLQHDPRQPIGSFPKVDLRADGLWVVGMIGRGFEPADTVRQQVEQRIVKAMSIGFRELRPGVIDRNGIYHVVSLELLEISLVSIPANQEAVFTMDDGGKLLAIRLLDEPSIARASSEPTFAGSIFTMHCWPGCPDFFTCVAPQARAGQDGKFLLAQPGIVLYIARDTDSLYPRILGARSSDDVGGLVRLMRASGAYDPHGRCRIAWRYCTGTARLELLQEAARRLALAKLSNVVAQMQQQDKPRRLESQIVQMKGQLRGPPCSAPS